MIETYLNYKYFLELYSSRQIVTACIALFVVLAVLYNIVKKKYKLPPGPTGVPILGYLPFLGEEPFKELDRLKKIHGNVFSISMGMKRVVILGDFEAVKEAFSKPTTSGRDHNFFHYLPDHVGFASNNGEEWSEQRKFCVKSMRGHGIGRGKWELLVEEEVNDFIKLVSSFNGQPFDISKIVVSSISNNISTFVIGKRLPIDHPDRMFLDKVLGEIMVLFDQSSIFTFFPTISDICISLGIGNIAKTYDRMVLFNNFFRKETGNLKETYKNNEHENFIVDYLKEMDNYKGKTGHYFKETNLLGNIQGLFIGGSDTSALSLTWLLIAMAKYPDIQAKVQQEVDAVLGKDGRIEWSDKKKLPYTYATVMEGQRWRTIVPLNLPRIATEDIKIKNYDIPKGTTIIANNWGLHNDPRYWKEPEKFDPTRFLTGDGKQIITKPESYVPFSYGKRNCPGDIVALMQVTMYFTALMQKFTVLVPEGKSVITNGKMGLTYHTPVQELRLVSREQLNLLDSVKSNK